MQTDKELFKVFQAVPQWLYLIRRQEAPTKVALESVTFKALEKHCDGILIPNDGQFAVQIVEFQGYHDPLIYARIGIEMGMLQQLHPNRTVGGVIVFMDRSLDPQRRPWNAIIEAVYLVEVLKELEESQPNHPLVAVFQPLLIDDQEILEQRAAVCYNCIRSSPLPDPIATSLVDVFCSWMFQRFRDKSRQEIEAMFIQQLPELRDTRVGQELIAIGKQEGKAEGEAKGKAEGEAKGRLESFVSLVHTLQNILGEPLENQLALYALDSSAQQKLVDELQSRIKSRLR